MEKPLNKTLNVALIGNPNSGKSTLFNALTGLKQHTGNFPGVTVEKKSGIVRISNVKDKTSSTVNFIDLPGMYCLFPKSNDELETYKTLTNTTNPDYPDRIVIVADASNLKRSLLLCTQVMDLGFPVILALNMIDLMERSNLELDISKLSKELGIPVVPINARDRKGLQELKRCIISQTENVPVKFENPELIYPEMVSALKQKLHIKEPYEALLIAANYDLLNENKALPDLRSFLSDYELNPFQLQSEESLRRYSFIEKILTNCLQKNIATRAMRFTLQLDKYFTHSIGGFAIFLAILFVIFQAIFSWSELPMQLIDRLFQETAQLTNTYLPKGAFTNLLTQGIIPGLGGILMFVPQIAILFAFIAILEDSGYMARVSFIMDRLLKGFGLNGKSIIPLISGVACAVPAIMSARTIKNWKERLITILVTPLMSCSARLPVYTLLISMVVPGEKLGIINLKGLILMGLYLIGFFAAIGTALILKWLIRSRERSYFIMELPVYRMPKWSVVGLTMFEKVKVFVINAGKVILAVSIILWGLASYGPGDRFEQLEKKWSQPEMIDQYGKEKAEELLSSEKLRNSYAGQFGRTIEPVIAPLGFDWKIGIALITSFAAREVFVGTMATIYGAGNADETSETLRSRMLSDTNERTGLPLFTLATSLALMIFYAFAMQCMSTIAVVYRETGGWKWPLIQLAYLSTLAWVSAYIVYTLFS